MMWNFVSDPQYEKWATNPVFAGHYQRVFENLARINKDKLKTTIGANTGKFIQFLVDHIDCLAYSLLLTTIIVNFCPDVISNYKLELKSPLLVEIPDRHGSANIGETIDSYISESIGVKL